MPGVQQANWTDCGEILRLFMTLPASQDCTLTLRMGLDRCIYVDCALPDGSVITQSTFQSNKKEE